MSQLNKIVRRVLTEADVKGTEPEEPSYWDEVGKTVDRYGRAIGDEVGRWSDAASELGAGAASAAGTLAKATLDTFVGQAHAPSRAGDVESARASRATLLDVVIPSIGSIISHLALTKFRISAKIADSAGLPVRDIISGKYGKEAMEDIFAGSVLHDVILGASFVPGAAVAGMLLDSVVYAAEGDRKGAIATLAMAGVFHAGGKVAARRADDAARGVVARKGGVEILAPKRYTDLNAAAKRGGFTHAVPPADRVTAIVKFVDDAGARMEAAGVKGGRQIAASASQAVRSGAISIAPALEDVRVAEAQQSATVLMTPGPGGETPLAAAKRIRNEVTVRKPVELPAEDRAGIDWLGAGIVKPIATPEAEALRGALSSAREKMKADPTPANKKAVKDAVKLAREKAYEKLAPDELARGQGSSHEDLMRNPKNVMSTPSFVTTAKQLYSKLGYDVNIIPIVGTHDAMFDKYLAKYPKYATGGEDTITGTGTRVVVVPHDEGKAILDAVEGVETKGGKEVGKMRVDTRGIGENTITIVPTVNSAGVDSLPTPWMISHGIFDSAAGNLLVQEGMLPATKKAVDRVEAIYNKVTKEVYRKRYERFGGAGVKRKNEKVFEEHGVYYAIDPATGEAARDAAGRQVRLRSDDPRVKELQRASALDSVLDEVSGSALIGTAVNSKWGENSRAMLAELLRKAEAIGDAAAEIGTDNARGYIVTAPAPQDAARHAEFKKLYRDFGDTLKQRSAPMVGKSVKSIEELPVGKLKRTKQNVQNAGDYLFRGETDHIAEIMTAGITKEVGYAPDLTLLDDPVIKLLYGEEGTDIIKKAAEEIAALLGPGGQNIKDAFAEDMKGNVLFVFPD